MSEKNRKWRNQTAQKLRKHCIWASQRHPSNANPTWGKITAIRASQHLQYKIPNTTNKNPEATVEGEEKHRPRPTTFPVTHYPTNVAVFWSQDKGMTTCKTCEDHCVGKNLQEKAASVTCHWREMPQVRFCHDKRRVCRVKTCVCRDKNVFVVTNKLFREKRFVTTNTHKTLFFFFFFLVSTSTDFVTRIVFVAAPAIDNSYLR